MPCTYTRLFSGIFVFILQEKNSLLIRRRLLEESTSQIYNKTLAFLTHLWANNSKVQSENEQTEPRNRLSADLTCITPPCVNLALEEIELRS